MLKRCHKCQKLYDTEDYFCPKCGIVLYDEQTEKKDETEPAKKQDSSAKKAEPAMQTENEQISKESDILVKQIALLCKYVTGGAFRVCTVLVIAAVACASIFEAFMQFATFTVHGETLTPYIASTIAFSIALNAFYTLLPAISMYKISMEAENYVAGSEGAFIWKANKSLTYITAYFIIQTIITGGAIGFVFNASMISALSEETGIATVLFLGAALAAVASMPYFISGLVTFSSAKGSLKKALPITAKGATVFSVCFMVLNILSAALLFISAVIFAAVHLTDITIPGTAPIIGLFSKMSKTYLIYIFIMLIRSVADIVISAGFLGFIKKLKRIK